MSTTRLKASFDGLSAGVVTLPAQLVGTGDSTPTALTGGGTKELEAAGPRSPRLKLTQVSGTACAVQYDYTGDAIAYRRLYWTPLSALATNHTIVQINDVASKAGQVNITSTGAIRIVDSTGATIATSATGLITYPGGPYRIEYLINHTAGWMQIRLYSGESTSALADIGGSTLGVGNFLTTSNRVFYGNPLATPTAEVMAFDDIKVEGGTSPTWIGPVATPAVANAGADFSVDPNLVSGATFSLNGSASTDPGGTAAWVWEDITSGTTTVPGSGLTRTITTPTNAAQTTRTYRLRDSVGGSSDTVVVTVLPHDRWMKTSSGVIAVRRML